MLYITLNLFIFQSGDTEVDHDNNWQGEDEEEDLGDWDASSEEEEVKEVKRK